MKQLIQNLRSGELLLEEVPAPACKSGFVLVDNTFSLISSGTERATVDAGKASLIGKAFKRPDLVKMVLANMKKEGVVATVQKVTNRLETPVALGYSCCGVVRESADFENKFKAGDRVACAGQGYASHAQMVAVPQNLVVKIPENVSFEEASFTTIGAIALQGVRQAQVQIGEKVCVIGLGLIGQVVCQILKANGCGVLGIDMNDTAVKLAQNCGIDKALTRNDEKLMNEAAAFTGGFGFDKVIIAASAKSEDPVVLSTEILRQKGVMVVVGDVKMDIPRNPHFYRKELELKISTSYGPGRYDPLYEEAGIDYPYGYVRFTENRNMETFLGLVARGALNLKALINKIYPFAEAKQAYEVVLNGTGGVAGVLLKYADSVPGRQNEPVSVNTSPVKKINIGFIGAGNFAQAYLLPHLKGENISLDTVVNASGMSSKSVAKRFGFNKASTNPGDVLNNAQINTVFIATRHDSHGDLVLRALKAGKNVFVEKPLTLSEQELQEIQSVYKGQSIFTVGYNRRFARISHKIKGEVAAPVITNIRVNAGSIPDAHWTQNAEIGGGRILGEVCHFVDLMIYLSRSLPQKVWASSVSQTGRWRSDDNVVINIEFANGSTGVITYTAMGNAALPKERVEVFSGGNAWVIDDFKGGNFYKNGQLSKFPNNGKGHKEEIEHFLESVKFGKPNPIPFEQLIATSQTTFKILECLKTGLPQKIS